MKAQLVGNIGRVVQAAASRQRADESDREVAETGQCGPGPVVFAFTALTEPCRHSVPCVDIRPPSANFSAQEKSWIPLVPTAPANMARSVPFRIPSERTVTHARAHRLVSPVRQPTPHQSAVESGKKHFDIGFFHRRSDGTEGRFEHQYSLVVHGRGQQ